MRFEKYTPGLITPNRMLVGGIFTGRIVRDGKVIDEWQDHNIVTNEGLDDMLSVYLAQGGQAGQWYMGVFKGNYQPTSNDKAASFADNATEATEYSSTTRVAYNPTEANQTASNASAPASFSFTSAISVYGAFIITSQGKGAKSGKLFAASQFAAPKNVAVNDQLLLSYAVAATSS